MCQMDKREWFHGNQGRRATVNRPLECEAPHTDEGQNVSFFKNTPNEN